MTNQVNDNGRQNGGQGRSEISAGILGKVRMAMARGLQSAIGEGPVSWDPARGLTFRPLRRPESQPPGAACVRALRPAAKRTA